MKGKEREIMKGMEEKEKSCMDRRLRKRNKEIAKRERIKKVEDTNRLSILLFHVCCNSNVWLR